MSFTDRHWRRFADERWAGFASTPGFRVRAAQSPPARRRRRRAAIGALVGVVLAVAIAVALLLGSGSSTTAYAVVLRGDGSVLVTIREAVGVTGADHRLAALNVPARVVPGSSACGVRRGQYASVRLPPQQEHQVATIAGPAAKAGLLIRPRLIPSGDTLVIGARQLSAGPPVAFGLVAAIYRGATPPCLRV